MAQSLESRINAALRSAARLKDVEGVISDVEAGLALTQVKLEAEIARSIDPALTTPQAREARNNAADLEHDVRRLNASLGLLVETRDRIVKSDAEAKRCARYDAAKAARDDLARHIRARYPELALELLALAKRIEASDAECAAVNRDSPRGAPNLESAEFLARETGPYWEMRKGGGEVTRIAMMRVPLLGREGGYLPVQYGGLNGSAAQWEAQLAEDQEFAKRSMPGVDPVSAGDQALAAGS